jgi:hypothetical protein
MTFQQISLALGAFFLLIGLWALVAPAKWRAAMLAFPRWRAAGWVLVVVDMVWFSLNIKATPLSSFEPWKVYLWVVTPVIIFLLIRFLDELLAARALGGLMLLVPGAIFDASRLDYDIPLRNVMVVIGYIIAIAGAFLVAGPHRFRRWMLKPTANDGNARVTGIVLAVIGFGIAALAIFFYGSRPA